MRRSLDGLGFACAVGFWLLTALYALLSSQTFAHEQFLQPELVPALAAFARWHGWIDLAVLAGFAATRGPRIRESRALRVALGFWAAGGLALLAAPPLFALTPGAGALVAASAALVPVGGLAWLEGRGALARAAEVAPPDPAAERTADDFFACLAAGLATTAIYAIAARLGSEPAQPLGAAWLAALAQSLVVHELGFVAAFCALTIVRGSAELVYGAPRRAELVLAAAALAGYAALGVQAVLLPGLSLDGTAPRAVGLALGAALALAVAARGAAQSEAHEDGLARVLSPLVPRAARRSRLAGAAWLAALGGLASALAAFGRMLDFNEIVARLGVGIVWLLVLAACLRQFRPGLIWRPAALYAAACVLLAGHVAAASDWTAAQLARRGVDLARARGAAVAGDPSLRLLLGMLEPPARLDAAWFAFLRAHTNVPRSVAVAPAELSLAPLAGAPAAERPHVFVFVVDSLRRDYLAPYNPAVTFTPEIARFAADALVFRRAFTRYGATGLSVPALWAGAPLLHKQYVTPFAPMNTLAKLLAHERYAQWLSMDNIVEVVVPPHELRAPLDRDVQVKDFRFCRTLGELEQRLAARAPNAAPVFAYTLPQDVHIAVVTREGGGSVDGAAYPGFSAPVASRVRRLDACFGAFVSALDRLGLRDDSIVILTSDHGDSLGEEGRLGHAYGLFPEVIEIPLVLALPPRLRERFEADVAAPAFNTDVTPTLYRLLGHELAPSTPLLGRSLVRERGEPAPPPREDTLVASSYGAVYGALLDDARQLYIIDTVNVREYGYALPPGAPSAPLPVDDALRGRGQRTIRATLEALAALHGYAPN